MAVKYPSIIIAVHSLVEMTFYIVKKSTFYIGSIAKPTDLFWIHSQNTFNR